MIHQHIDAEWLRRNFVEENLAHWLAAAPAENGFFRASLDRQWRPAEAQTATLVSQSRLIFVMAAGYDETGDKRYLDAARKGADFLLAHFADPEHGGWFWSVAPDGAPADTSKNAYGHAFAIFGLSHAFRVTGEPRFRDAALQTWETMKNHLRDEHGGIRPGAGPDWQHKRGGNSANPIMHLFEALLALHDATGSEAVFRDALALGDFAATRLYQPERGHLPENFDDDWRPTSDEKNGYVDLGHQFEWAFLFSQAVRQGFPRQYLAIGGRLLDFGMKIAFDAQAGGIFSASDYSGRVRGADKGWWQQTEHLRAVMRYAADHGRHDLWPAFDKSLAFVKARFLDSEYGGWYGSYTPDGPRTDVQMRKGSVWKIGYHETGMYREALRLARTGRRTGGKSREAGPR